VTITLSGDCGLKPPQIRQNTTTRCDNYLIRWLWIETVLGWIDIVLHLVTITLSGDCGLKRCRDLDCCQSLLWQLPYQVIVDWNSPYRLVIAKSIIVTITLSGDCGLKLADLVPAHQQTMWQLPYQVIVDWNDVLEYNGTLGSTWQLPYQVIVDWNTETTEGAGSQISDNYLIRWLWIETPQL